MTVLVAMAACTGSPPDLVLPRVRLVDPTQRWTGHDDRAQAGQVLEIGPFGPTGEPRLVVAAPDVLGPPPDPSPPGRVYFLTSNTPSGVLGEVAPFVEGTTVRFAECLRDLGDVNGDGAHDLGVCDLNLSLILPGPLDDRTHRDDAIARFVAPDPALDFPFVVQDFVVPGAGPEQGIILNLWASQVRVLPPIAGDFGPPPAPHLEEIRSETTDSVAVRSTGRAIVRLEGYTTPLLAFAVVSPAIPAGSGLGVLDGWPGPGSWEGMAEWDGWTTDPFHVRSIEAGDVDGDGRDDVVAGSSDIGQVFVLTEPLAGGRLREASIVLEGRDEPDTPAGDSDWFGLDTAVGDLDHDGHSDLVVAMPGHYYFDSAPGAFAVFLGPLTPGHYTIDDADLVGRDSDDDNDNFASTVEVGDLDGDGQDELVVGSMSHRGGGFDRGMVTVYDDLFSSR